MVCNDILLDSIHVFFNFLFLIILKINCFLVDVCGTLPGKYFFTRRAQVAIPLLPRFDTLHILLKNFLQIPVTEIRFFFVKILIVDMFNNVN